MVQINWRKAGLVISSIIAWLLVVIIWAFISAFLLKLGELSALFSGFIVGFGACVIVQELYFKICDKYYSWFEAV